MLRLPLSLATWPSERFPEVLKRELEGVDAAALPSSSYACGDRFSAMVIGTGEQGDVIRARVGIFYAGLTIGCNCADDPTPVEPQREYCELELSIDKATAETAVRLA